MAHKKNTEGVYTMVNTIEYNRVLDFGEYNRVQLG